ncbi:MAG: RICIN domain-containing protein [Terracidiphilus sp.]
MSTYSFIKSKLDGNVIDIQGASTTSGALLDAYPQKSSGTDNQMWEFVADPAGSGYFFIKSQLDGNVIDIQEASMKPGALLDAYPQKSSGTDNQLWQFVKDPAGSGYFFIVSKLNGYAIDIQGASTKAGASLDAYPLKASGADNQLWEVVGGSFPSPVAAAAAPASGLGSNSNYFLSDCSNIKGLTVTVNVTQDIVGSDGFGFQVNCYSAKSDFDGGQQYLIYLDPHSSPAQLYCMVDNWTNSSTGLSQIINHIVPLATLPSQKLPAGYQLIITLENDSSGNITGASYIACDNTGKTIGDQTITLIGLSLVPGGTVTSSDLAPIVSFQMNFVDYLNGGTTVLSSGAGWVTYTAANAMTVDSSEPSCVDWDFSTVEKANSSYGVLPGHANQTFTQSFGESAAGVVIDKKATVRHVTRRLPG